jgi:calcineurin-like phosphoesterase family protein
MTKTWLISDTHFGHEGVTRFLREDGTKLRPFSTVEEMDEVMITKWNSVVSPEDRIYHLGDIAMNRRSISVLGRLKGRKVLIKGNHDIFKLKDYVDYFDDVRAYSILEGCLLSHMPVHPQSLRRFGCNIHGHLHFGRVVHEDGSNDLRYHNISVEMTNFSPINWEDLKKRITLEGGSVEMKTRLEVYGKED